MSRVRNSFTSKVILYKEEKDLETICYLLKTGNEVIINVSLVDISKRYRVIDFVSGFVMAYSGKRKKIESNIYSFKIKG